MEYLGDTDVHKEWEKFFSNHVADKGLTSRIYENILITQS